MISYIIVDDEKAAHEIIKDYSDQLPYLKLKKHCYNALEAIEFLNSHMVDLVFLDINMPKLTGFDFLRSLSNPPKIIVTTAYKEFALEGFELNVMDYLLKPFGFPRFVTAVNRVLESLNQQNKPIETHDSGEEGRSVFIKDNKKHYQVILEDIQFVEAFGNYIKVQLEDKQILSYQTLSTIEKLLPEKGFLRVHKSFIVSIRKIQKIEGNTIFIADQKVPIGKTYRQYVANLIK